MKVLVQLAATAATMILLAVPAAHAGRFDGPGNDVSVAPAFTSVRYVETFTGGELAVVGVRGDGDTKLEVQVYDPNGDLIDSDRGYSCLVTWLPRRTGTYIIKVINHGDDANLFVLKTN